MIKVLAILVLAMLIQTSGYTQIGGSTEGEINLTNELVDSLVYEEYYGNKLKRRIANNLFVIYQFNTIKRKIGQTDTFRIFKNDNIYSASYNNKPININNKIIEEENVITLWGCKAHTLNFLFSETFDKNGKSQRITVAANKLNSKESSIKIENFINEVKSGLYRELTITGKPLVTGNYVLRDSTYQDTLITYDYETYDELVVIKTRNHIGVKCGEWIHYNNQGGMKIIEHEINCK